MYWENTADSASSLNALRDVVDVSFRVDCRCLPLDHAHALASALVPRLPWLATEPLAGVHLIHGAESGNGWYRPQDPDTDLLHLSRRARLRLRVPTVRAAEVESVLRGASLDVAGFAVQLGAMTVLDLVPLPVVFARYVVARADEDEAEFLQRMRSELQRLAVPARKLLSGRSHRLTIPGGEVMTRSLMVADLSPEDSLRLQRSGVGPHRDLGCGLFIGHKDVAPVRAAD